MHLVFNFAYDENENIPSRLGTTCISGVLTCLGNISCTSLYNNINTCLTSLSSYATNQCISYNTSLVSFINLSIVNTQSNLTAITNLSATNTSFSIANISTLTCYNKLIFSNSVLGTNYTGSRIILWPGSGTPTSTDWYSLGMNSYTMLYNGPTSAKHSFQINGPEYAYINSTRLTMMTNISFPNMVQGLDG